MAELRLAHTFSAVARIVARPRDAPARVGGRRDERLGDRRRFQVGAEVDDEEAILDARVVDAEEPGTTKASSGEWSRVRRSRPSCPLHVAASDPRGAAAADPRCSVKARR